MRKAQDKPAQIPAAALRAAAEVRMRQYESEYSLGSMTWRDFVPEVREVLQAAVPHMSKNAERPAVIIRRWASGQRNENPQTAYDRGYQSALQATLEVLGRRK